MNELDILKLVIGRTMVSQQDICSEMKLKGFSKETTLDAFKGLEKKGFIKRIYLQPRSRRVCRHVRVYFYPSWIEPDLKDYKEVEYK